MEQELRTEAEKEMLKSQMNTTKLYVGAGIWERRNTVYLHYVSEGRK